MQHRSRIFISAVSKELHSSRQLVANTLQFMGYEPDWQDTFETQEGDLRWMLRRRIDECQGVMQLVGQCYGAESKTIEDEEFGRVSYTQYEALYAKKQGKQLWIFVLDEDYPVDEHEAESEELAQLQQAYRKQVSSTGDLYYRMTNPDAIEAGTLKLRNELAALRRGFRRWAIGVSAVLALVFAITVWVFLRQGETNKAIGETAEAS